MYISTLLAFAVLGAAPLASAHCLISAATGNLGGNGTGLGVVAGGVNSQADVTVFKSTAGKFGATASVSTLLECSIGRLSDIILGEYCSSYCLGCNDQAHRSHNPTSFEHRRHSQHDSPST